MNISLLKEMIDDKYVYANRHQTYPITIYNYTAKAQYESVWNEVTMQCRGLILDDAYQIVAKPLAKFFNLGEIENQRIPNEPFEVYEKMDGSLGIGYYYDGIWHMATRGSFQSIQSAKAQEILNHKYAHAISRMEPGLTYLFEIIYPENRIVVNYGQEEALYLLAIVNNKTGDNKSLIDIGFPVVKQYNGLNDLNKIKEIQNENKEGYVIKYQDGYRLKVKFEEYCRLHRLITQVSSTTIWEMLKSKEPFEELLERVPDEFYSWVKQTKASLEKEYKGILEQCEKDYKVLGSRKETAMYFLTCKYSAVLFAMLDQKSFDEIIWKLIRPDHERPFVEHSTKN